MLPPPPRPFVNRRYELDAIDHFSSTAKGPSVVLITGLSGVGKTATAQQWAHLNRDRFPDGQLYADLGRGGVEPGEVLAAFLRALGCPGTELLKTLAERVETYRALTRGKRLLVLLDDVEAAAQLEPLIPASPAGVVLVTGRSRLRKLEGRDASILQLGPLDRGSARALLEAQLGARVFEDAKAIDELVRITGGQPLALAMVGASLVARPRPIGELVADLVYTTGRGQGGDAAGASFYVYSGTYRALSEPAAELYRRLAAHPGPSFTAKVAQVAAGWSERPVGTYLHELSRARLIESRGTWSRFYEPLQLHAQVALALDEPDAAEPAAQRIVAYYLASAAEVGHALDPGQERVVAPSGGGGVRLRSRREALAWFEAERPNLLAVQQSATRHEWHQEAWSFGEALWPAYRSREHADEALLLFSVATLAARRAGDASARERIAELAGRLVEVDELERVADVLAAADADAERTAPELYERLGFEAIQSVLVSRPAVRPEVEREPYMASGGASALLRMPDGTTLRIEAHRDSFALVWPARCSLAELVALVERPVDLEPDGEASVLLADGGGAAREGAYAELRERLVADQDVVFARLDLADLVVTWNRAAADGHHEIGLGAERFDADLFAELLRSSAVGELADWAHGLVREARDVLEAVLDGRLRRDEPEDEEVRAP